jgi:hypothetical protein
MISPDLFFPALAIAFVMGIALGLAMNWMRDDAR